MRKIPILLLLLILLPTTVFAQKKGKTKKRHVKTEIVENTEIIEIKSVELIEPDTGPVIAPVPKTSLFFRLTNTEKLSYVHAYFYCSQMEDSTFSYTEELGSHNNLAGGQYRSDNSGYMEIPEKHFAGREIRFKVDGYKTTRVSIEDIAEKATVTATLERDTYEYGILLRKKKKQNAGISLLENADDKFFYGRCMPIYYKDGNHLDPGCAFGYTGANMYVNENAVLANILYNKVISDKLRKKAKKGEFFLYLFSDADSDKNPKEFLSDIPILEENLRKMFTNRAKVKLCFKMSKRKN